MGTSTIRVVSSEARVSSRMRTFLWAFIVAVTVAVCSANYVSDADWAAYKNEFGKGLYPSTIAENNARYYFAVNRQKIAAHNTRAASGLETYTLRVNQYSDLRFLEFAALLPLTTDIPSNAGTFVRPTTMPPTFSFTTMGYTSEVQDQGLVCNSGWAYAAATAVKIFDAQNTGDQSSAPLSAQNFIDCAGASKSCVNQVSQVAFDYLRLGRSVFPALQYPNTPNIGQGMCNPPSTLTGKTITAYSRIDNGDDETLKLVVSGIGPVVIKFNPGTFEFMHYGAGIFSQPTPTQSASHYMTVVGYDNVQQTWLVQNSMGRTWGEAGFMRIQMNAAKPIANSAIFPSA